MKKVAIKCLSAEHGQEIKKYFQSEGLEILDGFPNSHNIGRFYGVNEANMAVWQDSLPKGYTEIELPFTPRYMYVSDEGEKNALITESKRWVCGGFKGHFVSTYNQEESLNTAELFVFAVEIPVETTKVKKELIAKLCGADFENIEFID